MASYRPPGWEPLFSEKEIAEAINGRDLINMEVANGNFEAGVSTLLGKLRKIVQYKTR